MPRAPAAAPALRRALPGVLALPVATAGLSEDELLAGWRAWATG